MATLPCPISEGGWGPQGGERSPSNDPKRGFAKCESALPNRAGGYPHVPGSRATFRVVPSGGRPTFGIGGCQKMDMVLVAQGGGRSPSNVWRMGSPNLEGRQVCAGGSVQRAAQAAFWRIGLARGHAGALGRLVQRVPSGGCPNLVEYSNPCRGVSEGPSNTWLPPFAYLAT